MTKAQSSIFRNCDSERFHYHSKSERTLKTTISEVRVVLSRLQCQGYGRSSPHLADTFEFATANATLDRWLQHTDPTNIHENIP